MNMLEQLTGLRKTASTYVYMLLKDMLKDANEQPDEEIHMAISGSIQSARAFVPVKLGCITLPVHGLITNRKVP